MPRRFVFVVVWLAGVAVAMLLATAAVGLVGDRVTSRPVPRLSQASVEATLRADGDPGASVVGIDELAQAPGADSPTTVDPASGARQADGSGDGRSSASLPGEGSGPSDPSGVSGGGDDLSGPSSGGSGGSGSGSSPDGPGPTPATSAPVQVSATFTAEGGSVGVTCSGRIISRDFVTPKAGFALDPSGSSGPGEVDVRFRSTSDSRATRIRVTCPDGVPVERIDS